MCITRVYIFVQNYAIIAHVVISMCVTIQCTLLYQKLYDSKKPYKCYIDIAIYVDNLHL